MAYLHILKDILFDMTLILIFLEKMHACSGSRTDYTEHMVAGDERMLSLTNWLRQQVKLCSIWYNLKMFLNYIIISQDVPNSLMFISGRKMCVRHTCIYYPIFHASLLKPFTLLQKQNNSIQIWNKSIEGSSECKFKFSS